MSSGFCDRADAGRQLARQLLSYRGSDAIVLGLPRGGVPVALEIARALQVPLDVFLVRKLGVPGFEELAMGAIAAGGRRMLNSSVVETRGISSETVERVTAREQRELQRRARVYRQDRPQPTIRGRPVILVDDGIATGATARVAIAMLQTQQPREVVLAVPVCPPDTLEDLRCEVDRVACLLSPEPLHAIGFWYEDFSQTSDAEVCELLARSKHAGAGAPPLSLSTT